MTVSQKVSVSLLISVLLFAAFSVIAFTGLFDLIEARFYNPSITKQALKEINADAALVDTYIKEVQGRFSALLKEAAVQRSFLPNQSAEDIFERSKATGLLLEATNGLQWIRFIDVGGKRIHYSTLREDILRQDATSLAYKNYGDNPQDPPFDLINIPDTGKPRIIGDANQERLLFCFPFYDSFSVYRGTAVFSLSVRSITERMIREGRLRIGEEVSLIADPLGFVTGLPRSGKTVLIATIGSSWKDGILGPVPLTSDNGNRFALLSVKTESALLVGRLLEDRLFVFPFAMKLILLASFFLTSFLLIFLLFNVGQDTTTIVRERLKRLQLSLLEEYYDKKEAIDWNRWSREMEQRREAVRSELKRGLPRKPRKKLEQDIDNLIDKSWDEIITILGGKEVPQVTATFDENKLQELLNRVLSTVSTLPPAGAPAQPVKPAPKPKTPAPAPQKQAPAVSAPPAEEAEAEALEELEEVEAVEEAAEAEELPAEAEPAEEAEAETEAEALEELEEVEAVEEAAEAEVAPAVSAAPAEEAEAEAEALEELEEVEAVEEAAEAEELPAEAVPAVSAGPAEEAENEALEELEELEEVEAVEEAAEAAAPAVSAGPAEEAEAEALEELEELEEVEAVEEAAEAEELPAEAAPPAEEAETEALEELEEVEAVEEAAEAATALSAAPAEEAEALEELEELPELEDIKQYQRKSNLRIVFGEDDIPTIIETSGLELVDSDEASVLAILEQKNANALEELESVSDEYEQIETLSELEEAELPEPAEKGYENAPGTEETPNKKPVDMEELIDQIAREIEFSPFPETAESTAVKLPDIDFEIVSPFDTLLSKLKETAEEETEHTQEILPQEGPEELEAVPEELEELSEQEASPEGAKSPMEQESKPDEVQELESIRPSPSQIIMYRPFSNGAKIEPPLLEEVEEGGETAEEEVQEAEELINMEETDSDEEQVIVEHKNGLLYIASTVYQEAQKKKTELNPDLQHLVDSVLSAPKS